MADPHLVMLDEPTAGVNPALTESLLEHIRDLNAEGVTIVFVEHNMDVVMDISDWVVVMAQGRILTEGPPEEVVANEEVIDRLPRAGARGAERGRRVQRGGGRCLRGGRCWRRGRWWRATCRACPS